jgi:hypothetical protein
LHRLNLVDKLDFANKIAKTSTEIHCFKTNLSNLVDLYSGQTGSLDLAQRVDSVRFAASRE